LAVCFALAVLFAFAFAFTFVSQHIVAAIDNRVGPALDLARTHMDHPLDLEDPAIKRLPTTQFISVSNPSATLLNDEMTIAHRDRLFRQRPDYRVAHLKHAISDILD